MSLLQESASHVLGPETEFAFREVRTESELRRVLALRYEVYSRTDDMKNFSSLDAASGLDCEDFDLVARHFALFARTHGAEWVAGTLRIVNGRPSRMSGALAEIASAYPSIKARIARPLRAPLPGLCEYAQSDQLRPHFDRRVAEGEYIAEPGRLALHPRVRHAAGRAGLRLSCFVIECALAFGWMVEEFDRVFVDCNERLAPLYTRYGFARVPGVEITLTENLNFSAAMLQATPASLPPEARDRVESLAAQLRELGEAAMPMPGVRSRSNTAVAPVGRRLAPTAPPLHFAA